MSVSVDDKALQILTLNNNIIRGYESNKKYITLRPV